MTYLLGRVLVALFLMSSAAAAQEKPKEPAPSKPPVADVVSGMPLRAQIVIARYAGEKRVSSLPYSLSFNGARASQSQVRMGAEIPIEASGDGNAPKTLRYDHIGTQIDCRVNPSDDGQYVLQLSISEKSVYGEGKGPEAIGFTPAFRSYRSSNTVVLKVGESTQFTAAADRLTGEVVRVEVTLQAGK